MRIKYINEKTGTVTIVVVNEVSYSILKNRFYVTTEKGVVLTFYINSRNFDDLVMTLTKYGWIDLTGEQLINVR